MSEINQVGRSVIQQPTLQNERLRTELNAPGELQKARPSVFHGDVPYENFEERLILFISALRYWKDWLSSSVLSNSDNSAVDTNTLGMLKV